MGFQRIKMSLLLLLIAGLLLGTAGCINNTPENTTEKTAKYTDMLGREVELTTDVKRIIAVRYMDIYYLAAILGKELDDKLLSLGMSYAQNDIDGYKKFSEVYKNIDKLAI